MSNNKIFRERQINIYGEKEYEISNNKKETGRDVFIFGILSSFYFYDFLAHIILVLFYTKISNNKNKRFFVSLFLFLGHIFGGFILYLGLYKVLSWDKLQNFIYLYLGSVVVCIVLGVVLFLTKAVIKLFKI